MHSSSSQSSNTTILVPYEEVKCRGCWRVAELLPSKSNDNPGRLYYRCNVCSKFLRWWLEGKGGKEKGKQANVVEEKLDASNTINEVDYGYLVGEIIQLKEDVMKMKMKVSSSKEEKKKMKKEMEYLREDLRVFQTRVILWGAIIVIFFLAVIMCKN